MSLRQVALRDVPLANLILEQVARYNRRTCTTSSLLSRVTAAHQALAGGDRDAAAQHLRQIQTDELETCLPSSMALPEDARRTGTT